MLPGEPPRAASPGDGRDALDAVLLSLAAVTWDFALVGRTRMLTEALLDSGGQTLFVQSPSMRTSLQRLTARPCQPFVVRPWQLVPARWWSAIGRRGLAAAVRVAASELRRQLERRLDGRAADAVVVTPAWTPWLEHLPLRRVVYDCIDEVGVHVPRAGLSGLFRSWERELIARCSGAVSTASALSTHLRSIRADLPIALIRNGVDAARFEALSRQATRPPDVPPPGGRPIVGFVGALYEWIDWELIDRVVRALPECDFVFVGPHDGRGEVERIARHSNAILTGWRPYEQVPAYIAAFDACWVPFDRSDVSRAANPVKMYEYLAIGKPVVSTVVADVESFGDLVAVVEDAGQAAESLRRSIAEGADRAEERRAFARANSWAERAAELRRFVRGLPG